MHPTMEQILGSLVGSGSELPSVAQCEDSSSLLVSGEKVDSEDAEEAAMMQVLGGIDDKVVKSTSSEEVPTCDTEKEQSCPMIVDKEESEKRLQQLKLRQSQLEDRFTSLNRRIQALRTFKYGSHVAQQLCRLRKMGKKNANPEGSRLHMSQIEGHLKFLLSSQEGLDSEATESSSGGESCDEMESFPAHNLQYLPIQKRAKWTWLKNRASLASKWTWLTAQISDLEFKIRQQTELYRQIRAAKAPVLLEKPYRRTEKAEREIRTLQHSMGRKIVIKEPLCPPEREEEEAMGASRTRPVKPFVRRKVLSTKNLYRSSPQAAKECTVRCHCLLPDRWCAICYGKKNTARVPSREGRDSPQSIALLDHSYHHVISSKSQDVSLDLHMMTKIKNRSWLTAKESSQTVVPATMSVKKEISTEEKVVKKPLKKKKKAPGDHLDDPPSVESSSPLQSSKSVKKKKKSDKSRRRSLTLGYDASLHDYCTDDMDDIDSSPLPSPSISGDPNNRTWIEHVKRRRESAYDIDNIVIPYSIAASTRVERIKYKEIITPTWRVVQEEEEFEMKDLLLSKSKIGDSNPLDEDVSQMAYEIRHRKAELEEQRRWKALPWKQTGGQRVRSRRQDSKTDLGSGCNTPDPLSPGMVDALEVSTRPSTPLSVTDETPQSIRERRRTTSSTKLRDRLDENNTVAQSSPRSSTPNSIDQTPCVTDADLDKPPFEARTFPISETEYEKMAADMPVPSRVSTNNYSQPETQSLKDDEEEEDEEGEVLDTSSCESKKPSQTQSISSEKIPSSATAAAAVTATGNINHNSNSSCEASSDEDGDFVMEDDLDWNGDDPNDPEWGESQSKSEH